MPGRTSRPYIEQSGLDTQHVPANRSRGTRATAGSQCALPFLTDAMGLYYNKDLLAKHGYHRAAEDDVRAHRDGQGAHGVQPGRLDQGGRVRPLVRLLRVHAAGAVDHLRRRLLQRGRHRVRRSERPGLGRRCSSGRRTSSTSTARTTSRSSSPVPGDEWSARQRLPARTRRDDVRRRVARGDDRGLRARPELRHRPVPDARRAGGPVRDRPGRRDDHRHPAGLGAPRRGVARSCSTWPRTRTRSSR